MRINEFLEKYTTQEIEKSIRDGIDPLGGKNSPIKRPASPSKKLLQKINLLEAKYPTSKKELPDNLSGRASPNISPSNKQLQL